MLQLLSPAGLWALAALSLPLAIHLWRPPPRTVRLGSLRFLENLPRRLHDLRWRERWLLALRLALLTLLALLLAGPRWQPRPPRGPQRWGLLDPAAKPDAGSLDRLRALESAGYEIRALAPGFPVTTAAPPEPRSSGNADAPALWSLLSEADAELPAGSSLAVFSPGRMASLRGTRPALRHCRVEWVHTLDATAPADASAPVFGPAPEVVILHDADRAGDARFVAAAVRAVASQARWEPIRIHVGASDPHQGESTKASWIFWLSAQPVPSDWAKRTVNIISEEASETANASDEPASWIVPIPAVSGAPEMLGPVRLWRRAPPPLHPAGAVADWADGFGRPLLTVERKADGARWWRFYGRFDPAWNDLPRGALAAWMRALLVGGGEPWPPRPFHDDRLADPSQCRPSDQSPARVDVTLPRAMKPPVDLRAALWTLAAILFGLERWWSHRRRAVSALTPAPAPAAVAASAR